ncbi:MAG TPA: lipoprotein [Steroidobacteraceae bacterium]|nr:lipoprotein [Steroidobacteraceae bacterium]
MRTTTTIRWMLVAAMLAAAGCGQKGALYLPEKKTKVVTHPGPTSASASASASPASSSSSSS